MFESLREYILEQLAGRPNNGQDPRGLTVGVEHEFFLECENRPCTHGESQAFLKKLSESSGWHIQSVYESPLGSMIDRVSRDDTGGRFTAVKYDHHPHLLEVAFAYQSTLFELSNLVSRTLDKFSKIAESLGLTISKRCLLDISPFDPALLSPLDVFCNLRNYRNLLLMRLQAQGKTVDLRHSNYAAVIAATQTHVGGLAWWRKFGLVDQLYALEPDLLAWSASAYSTDLMIVRDIIKRRWEGYKGVFSGYPLVGFPDVRFWNVDSWVNALLNSPLCGTPGDRCASKTLEEIGHNPFSDWKEFFVQVRDLQVIRPRLFGTLEFRADAAQPSAELICAMAALRLGICSRLLNGEAGPTDLIAHRRRWWNLVEGGTQSIDCSVLELGHSGLLARGEGEEAFLGPLLNRKHELQKVTA